MVKIGSIDTSPHMGEVVGYGYYFSLIFGSRASAQPMPGAWSPHIVHQSMRFGPRTCLLGVSTRKRLYFGELFPKTPHFLAAIGISSLNVGSNNFRTANRFQSNVAQTMHLRKRNSIMRAKLLKFAVWGVNAKTSQREFPSQNTPFYNLLTTRPVHTNSNWIDTARQVLHDTKLKHVKISI